MRFTLNKSLNHFTGLKYKDLFIFKLKNIQENFQIKYCRLYIIIIIDLQRLRFKLQVTN